MSVNQNGDVIRAVAVKLLKLLLLRLLHIGFHDVALQYDDRLPENDLRDPLDCPFTATHTVQSVRLLNQRPKPRLILALIPQLDSHPSAIHRQHLLRAGVEVKQPVHMADIVLKILINAGKDRKITMEKAVSLPVNLREGVHEVVTLLLHPDMGNGIAAPSDDLNHQIEIPSALLIEQDVPRVHTALCTDLLKELHLQAVLFLRIRQKGADLRLYPIPVEAVLIHCLDVDKADGVLLQLRLEMQSPPCHILHGGIDPLKEKIVLLIRRHSCESIFTLERKPSAQTSLDTVLLN